MKSSCSSTSASRGRSVNALVDDYSSVGGELPTTTFIFEKELSTSILHPHPCRRSTRGDRTEVAGLRHSPCAQNIPPIASSHSSTSASRGGSVDDSFRPRRRSLQHRSKLSTTAFIFEKDLATSIPYRQLYGRHYEKSGEGATPSSGDVS